MELYELSFAFADVLLMFDFTILNLPNKSVATSVDYNSICAQEHFLVVLNVY